MTDRMLARLAWTVAGVSLAFMAAGAVLVTIDRAAALPPAATPWPGSILATVGFAPMAVVGGLIASRIPRNPYGWLWLLAGLGNGAMQGFFTAYALHSGFVSPLPGESAAVVIADLGWPLAVSTLPFILLLFPTGRPASKLWGAVCVVSGGAILLLFVFGPAAGGGVVAGMESPFGAPEPLRTVAEQVVMGCVYALIACTMLGAISLALRFRAARGIERQQLKWFAYAALIFIVALLANESVLDLGGAWDPLLETLGLLPIPIAVAVAMLRYRLYEIDRIIHRTLVYALLSAVLAGIYLGSVAVLQTPVRSLMGGDSQLAIVIATLLVAVAFSPLRRRLQAAIDRAFNRQRYDARGTLDRVATAMRTAVELEPLAGALVKALQESVQPAHASIWLRDGPPSVTHAHAQTSASVAPGRTDGRSTIDGKHAP